MTTPRRAPAAPAPAPASSWLVLHPKVKALALAVAVLILASIVGGLNGTVSWHSVEISDATGVLGLLVAYLKSS